MTNICWKCCKLYQITNRLTRLTFRRTRLQVNTDSPRDNL